MPQSAGALQFPHAISPFPLSQVMGSDPTLSVAAPALMAVLCLRQDKKAAGAPPLSAQ